MATASRRPDLPAYDALQHAFHEAFRPELFAILDGLPLPPRARALDVPCGDGFYAARLAQRVGPAGRLIAADASDAYLGLARESLHAFPCAEARKADAYRLPFDDDCFDLVWSAQSFISLDDPAAAVAEMVRVVRPGGHVAVLESDEIHHVLLPWSVDLELALHRALAHVRGRNDNGKLVPARWVRAQLQEAGLRGVRRNTVSSDRVAPLGEWEAEFLRRHLEFLAEKAGPKLMPDEQDTMRRESAALFDRPDAELTCLNVVHLGRKPRTRRRPG